MDSPTLMIEIVYSLIFLVVAFGIGKGSQKISSYFLDDRKAKIFGYSVFGILSVLILFSFIQDLILLGSV